MRRFLLGVKPAIQANIWGILPKIWEQIEVEYLESLSLSMYSTSGWSSSKSLHAFAPVLQPDYGLILSEGLVPRLGLMGLNISFWV